MSKDLSVLRRSAAHVFALAAIEAFPEAQLAGGQETSFGFCYDIDFPFVFQDEFLRLIEEKMRAIKKEARLIELTEMMPENAASYFEHIEQRGLSKRASESTVPLLNLVRIGEFADISAPPILSSTGDVGSFRLLGFREIKGRTRLFGAVFSDEKNLKEFLKKGRALPEHGHIEWGQQLELFSPSPFLEEGCFVWHPDGVALCDALKKLWHDLAIQAGVQFLKTPSLFAQNPRGERLKHFHTYYVAHPQTPHLAEWSQELLSHEERLEGMLCPKVFTTDFAFLFCKQDELATACFSSLQLIIKILKMLSFELQLVFYSSGSKKKGEPFLHALKKGEWDYQERLAHSSTPSLEVQIADGIGRYWRASCLELISCQGEGQKTVGIAWSVFAKLERIIALLLEKTEGELPFWLAPEQVRLIIVDEKAVSYAHSLSEELVQKGFRTREIVASKESLSQEMRLGLTKKVPYIVVIGDREQKRETVTVRKSDAKEKETMKCADFFEILKTQEVLH